MKVYQHNNEIVICFLLFLNKMLFFLFIYYNHKMFQHKECYLLQVIIFYNELNYTRALGT